MIFRVFISLLLAQNLLLTNVGTSGKLARNLSRRSTMEMRIFKRLGSGVVIAGFSLIFLTTLVSPAFSHRVVRRQHYRHNGQCCTTHYYRNGHVVYIPTTTIHRYHPRYGYDCRYSGGYYYNPYYGRHYHGRAGVGIYVRF